MPLGVRRRRRHRAPRHDRAVATSCRSFLGLDVNTNSTGYALIDSRQVLRECGAISTAHCDDIFAAGLVIRAQLEQIRAAHAPTHVEVCVEDFMRAFGGRGWQTKGLFALAQVNALVCYDSLFVFDATPMRVHPTTARAFFGLSAAAAAKEREARGAEPKAKQIKQLVLQFARQHVGPQHLAWSHLAQHDHTVAASSARVPDAEAQHALVASEADYDKSDAFVMAMFALKSRWASFAHARVVGPIPPPAPPCHRAMPAAPRPRP